VDQAEGAGGQEPELTRPRLVIPAGQSASRGPGASAIAPAAIPVESVAGVGLRLCREDWPFARQHALEIEEHWLARKAGNPHLYNGAVLKVRDSRIENGTFVGEAFTTDFASFLFWRDRGFPDRGVRNVFGSAVVRSAESDLVLGRMAGWTSNSDLVYPFGGSLVPDDVRAGWIDVEASIARELLEETGIGVHEGVAVPGFLAIFDGPRVSLAKILNLPLSTEALVQRIRAFIAGEERPELSDVHVVRSMADLLPDRMPPYTQALVHHLFNRCAREGPPSEPQAG
jgi:hypothetical protein